MMEKSHNNLNVSLMNILTSLYILKSTYYALELAHLYVLIDKYFYLACVTDRYPPKLPKKCKEKFSCAQLKKDKKCSMSYEDAMSKSCNDKISRGLRSQLVENYCKRSCLNCPGNFVFFCIS